jgi:CDP-diacylglycerol--glycerol-3-phosphate 3-phosphatidyltransferase
VEKTRGFARARLQGIQGGIVTLLAVIGIRPNHVTIAGFLVAAGSGYLASSGSLRLAGAVYLVGSALDALDGALARRTGRVSRFGAFLDSLLDRAGEGALLLGLAAYFSGTGNQSAVVLTVAALLGSLLVSYARARGEGLGVSARSGIAPRPFRVILLAVGLIALRPEWALATIAVLSAVTVSQRVIEIWRAEE